MVAFHHRFFAGEGGNCGVVGSGLFEIDAPRHIAAEQHEVVLAHTRAPIFAHALEMVEPTVTEDVHRLFYGVREVKIAYRKHFHAPILTQNQMFATSCDKMSAARRVKAP